LLLETLSLVASTCGVQGGGGLRHPASRFAVSSPGKAMTREQRGSRLFWEDKCSFWAPTGPQMWQATIRSPLAL